MALINKQKAIDEIRDFQAQVTCGFSNDWESGINEGFDHAIAVIELMETVDAIPVEWINKYTNEHRTYMHAFSEMVACWYDEKEKREYEMASDMRDYCEKYEPTYNPEDGSL